MLNPIHNDIYSGPFSQIAIYWAHSNSVYNNYDRVQSPINNNYHWDLNLKQRWSSTKLSIQNLLWSRSISKRTVIWSRRHQVKSIIAFVNYPLTIICCIWGRLAMVCSWYHSRSLSRTFCLFYKRLHSRDRHRNPSHLWGLPLSYRLHSYSRSSQLGLRNDLPHHYFPNCLHHLVLIPGTFPWFLFDLHGKAYGLKILIPLIIWRIANPNDYTRRAGKT